MVCFIIRLELLSESNEGADRMIARKQDKCVSLEIAIQGGGVVVW